jgi:hypothetical protein
MREEPTYKPSKILMYMAPGKKNQAIISPTREERVLVRATFACTLTVAAELL